MRTNRRFEDSGLSIHSFLSIPILVVCPRCSKCARVAKTLQISQQTCPSWNSTVTCLNCGFAKSIKLSNYYTVPNGLKEPLDPFLQLPLWLQAPCAGNILWALNYEHLSYLQDLTQATLRQRTHLVSWQNTSLASRLPKWLTAASNREFILQAIQKLRLKEC